MTIRGELLCRSSGRAAWTTRQGPKTLVSQHLVRALEVVVGGPGRLAEDAGVIDDHVERPRPGLDPGDRGADALVVGDVELDREHVLARLDLRRVAGACDHHEAVIARQLRRDLGSDPAAGAGDQRDAQILFLSSTFLPITMRWISEVPSPISSSGASR